MSLRNTLILTVAAALCFGGCTKKDKQTQTDSDFSQAPALSEPDTADIFNEFYDEQAGSSGAGSTTKTAPSAPASKTPKKSSPDAQESSQPAAQGQFGDNGSFTLQLATISSRQHADKVIAQLQAKGYPAYIAEVQNPTPELIGTYFRVRIGFFSGVSAAKRFAEQSLVPAGYEYWIDNRSNDNVGIQGEGFGQSDVSAYSSSATTSSSASSPASSSQPQDYSGSSSETSSSAPTSSSTSSSNDSWGSSSGSSTTGAGSSTTTPASSSATPTQSSSSSTTDSAAPRDSNGSWSEDSWGSSDW